MPSPPPDGPARVRMEKAHDHAAAEFGLDCDGQPAWGWQGRTLGHRGGPYWLRVLSTEPDNVGGKLWEGTVDAEASMSSAVPRPHLVRILDWQSGGCAYRAESARRNAGGRGAWRERHAPAARNWRAPRSVVRSLRWVARLSRRTSSEPGSALRARKPAGSRRGVQQRTDAPPPYIGSHTSRRSTDPRSPRIPRV